MNYLNIVLIILAGIFLLSLLNFYISIRPPKYIIPLNPANFNLRYENISFGTSDDILIKGWFIPNNNTNKTIIITHGYPFDKGNIMQATYFLANHFNLLYFDFRYFGESQGKYTSIGYHEKKDFLAAIEYLKNRNLTDIGAYGFSLGAATILIANSPDINAIVADSSFSEIDRMIKRNYFIFPSFTKMPFVWLTKLYAYIFLGIKTSEISPLNEITKINVPILLIHAKQDSQIPVENSEILYKASNKSITELWLLDGEHGTTIADAEYKKKIIDFFKKNL